MNNSIGALSGVGALGGVGALIHKNEFEKGACWNEGTESNH